ncbi:unnamed protein product [Effrenium voratum]|nr:unnamed protein product [Effrenium voratum]
MPASLSRPSRTVAAAEAADVEDVGRHGRPKVAILWDSLESHGTGRHAAGCLFRDAGRVELNSQEHFCLSWERWAEELAAAVAARQPWPLPPQSHEAPAPLLRLAEAAMNAFAAVWSGEVECQRLLRQDTYDGRAMKLRVLCLHGRCQTSGTFQRKLEKIAGKSASFAEFVFIDGPLDLPLQHGERVNTKGWWEEGEARTLEVPRVRQALLAAWDALGPFDGVLGFSEGAAVAAALGPEDDGGEVPAFASVRFKLLFSAPRVAELPFGAQQVASLHGASKNDTAVPLAESREVASLFAGAEWLEHEGGHVLPTRAEDIKRVAAFLEAQREAPSAAPAALEEVEEQKDEVAVLAAMFEEELTIWQPTWPVRLSLRLLAKSGPSGALALRFLFPPGYPQKASCCCELEAEDFAWQAHRRELLEAAEVAREPLGFPSVAAMFGAAQAWVEEHGPRLAKAGVGVAEEAEEEEEEEETDSAWWLREESEVDEALLAAAEQRARELLPESDTESGWARQCGAGSYGRSWDFVVGLVGKPSAGKSTLFNAATRLQGKEAAMAPHPFTTIDPNVGPGWFGAPCPSVELGIQEECFPEHGRVGLLRRFPLLVKDVAGLVPGAYMGRGRGNAFLNDLCDADSLIHVVDASGRSDAEGVDQGAAKGKQKEGTDPLDEVGWVRREIHLWIFCNVRAKWDTVRRKAKLARLNSSLQNLAAERLFALFTGYRASQQLAAQVYEATGHHLANLAEDVLTWTELHLHILVACFLRVRFPIVVALNKADTAEAAAHIPRVQAALGRSAVPVSARSELWLLQQQKKGHLTYAEGGGAESISLAATAPAEVKEQVEQLCKRVLGVYKSTGVMEVLSQAVSRRSPIFCCPVLDFASLESLQRPSGGYATAKAVAKPKLASMVMLRPLSTVEEVHAALKNEQMLRGDLVRAELLNLEAPPQAQVLRREDVLKGPKAMVLRILTNKKAK